MPAVRKVATYTGVDSGGVCPCTTPPTALAPVSIERNVFINKQLVMAAGDVLAPATGATCTTPTSPCTSPRIVVSAGKVFLGPGKKPIARIGDFLNQSTNIKIVGTPFNVFAGEA